MTHFDFVVEDADADSIFDCIQAKIVANHEIILELMDKKSAQATIDMYLRDITYLTILKKKMLHYKENV